MLHHYTNSSGLLGIIESSVIWASDIRFLNDSTELEFARNALKERYENLSTLPPSVPPANGGLASDSSLGLTAMQRLDGLDRISRCFVACFCASGDLLSQWRGYASEQGFSLAFDSAELQAACETFGRERSW